MANDSVAQSGAEDVTFGTITCRRLEVVDDEGKNGVVLHTDEDGGMVWAIGKDGGRVSLTNTEHGGSVWANGKNGGYVRLANNEHGGSVWADGKDGGYVRLANNEHGGFVGAIGKNGSGAQLENDKYGGSMAIFNKGEKNVLQASVTDTGGGTIRTKDKLGYRTGRLP